MEYLLQGRNEEILGMQGLEGHELSGYVVRISPSLLRRWAEVRCSCGAGARTQWSELTITYRALIAVAWFDACGSTERLGAESLQRLQE